MQFWLDTTTCVVSPWCQDHHQRLAISKQSFTRYGFSKWSQFILQLSVTECGLILAMHVWISPVWGMHMDESAQYLLDQCSYWFIHVLHIELVGAGSIQIEINKTYWQIQKYCRFFPLQEKMSLTLQATVKFYTEFSEQPGSDFVWGDQLINCIFQVLLRTFSRELKVPLVLRKW